MVSCDDIYTYEYFFQEDVCRFCWSREAERDITSKITEKGNIMKNDLIDKIRDCLDIDLSEEIYPKKACITCCDKVEEFHAFKTFCRKQERKLHEILNRQNEFDSIVKIEKTDVSNLELNKVDIFEDNFHHTDEDSNYQPSGNENEVVKTAKFKKKKYKTKRSPTYCNICHIDLESKENLEVHNSQTHGIEDLNTYKCFGCDKRFKSRKTRLSHELNFCKGLRDGYKCMNCNRYLPKRRMYETHMKYHRDNITEDLPEDIFQCKKCHKYFKTKDCLKNHMFEHDSSKKKYVCETCGRVFTRQDYLHKHKLTHTGTKQHVCPHCSFRATQRSSLTIHIRKHTGERPYSCDVCPQRCISSSNLRAHRRKHLGQKRYECTICSKKFGYKVSLDEHIASTHERSQSHPCEHCGAIYTRVRGLRRHLLTKHGKQAAKIEKSDNEKTEEFLNKENMKNDLKSNFELKDADEFVLLNTDGVVLSTVCE